MSRRLLMGKGFTHGSVSKSYTFSGVLGNSTGNTSDTLVFNLGAANANRYVLVGIVEIASATAPSAVTANGVTLPSLVSASNVEVMALFGAVVSAGSGNQNISFSHGAFGTEEVYVWVLNNLNSTSVKHSGFANSSGGSPDFTINVTASDFIFMVGGSLGGNPNFSGSTQAPIERGNDGVTVTSRVDGADTTIISTNASFGVALSQGNGGSCAVTFA